VAGGTSRREGGAGPFQASLRPFYLAIHAVTNAQYKRFIDATDHAAPSRAPFSSEGPEAWQGRNVWPAMADHPVVGVSWDDAVAYCRWAGARLPTELEWEKGARGTDGRSFPWGNEWTKERCHNEESRRNETTCSVWRYGTGSSVWGCYQMAGNVWEWCQDWHEPGAYRRYAKGDLTPPAAGTAKVVRGGSWFNLGPDSFLASYRFHFPPGERERHYGVRVAKDPLT